jgi:L,D-peptidoglycan transpeptidase YkuD (ErfK/YbiS/YcfS/YnhG family)
MKHLFIITVLFASFSLSAQDTAAPLMQVLSKNASLKESSQAIVILGSKGSSQAYLFEKTDAGWKQLPDTFQSIIGRTGFAAPDKKREGDGKTPSGIFPLSLVFGYASSADTRMPYRQAAADDFWVDDVSSLQYNTWVKGKPAAKSFEKMKRNDNLYKWGIVVEYNTNPIVAGNGSAIFLHVWSRPNGVTDGCAAFSEENILKVLKWLDPAKKPVVVMGLADDLRKL